MAPRSRLPVLPPLPVSSRPPGALLAPYVSALWCVERTSPRPFTRESSLPSGAAHVVFRLGREPVTLFASESDLVGERYGSAVVCGVRSRPYLRDVTWPTTSVGATLRCAAAGALFGVTGLWLAERHVALDTLWGPAAAATLARLEEAAPASRLDVLERALLARLSPLRAMHPAIAHALTQLSGQTRIAALVEESGYSHRRFVSLFRETVGLTPKQFGRLLRFRQALALVQAERPLIEIAGLAGYADQAHFAREFREHAGLSPGAYRELSLPSRHHVPAAGSISFKTLGRARGTV